MKYHPDHNNGDAEAEAKFKEINEAYSVLSNPEKRRSYDNPNFFENLFRGTGFGFERRRPQKPDLNAPRDGQMIIIEAELPLYNFVFGGTHKIDISYHEGCVDCGGKGFHDGTECDLCQGSGYIEQVERRPGFVSSSMRPCSKCNGLGQVATTPCNSCGGSGRKYVQRKEFKFDIPVGSGVGSKFVLRGAGRSGLNGGRNGDVVLVINNIKPPELNKLTSEQVESLKSVLEVLDNVDESA
jgi:molecular chaperone DnaJ